MFEVFILNISRNNLGLYSTALFLNRVRVFHEGIRGFTLRAVVLVLGVLDFLKHFYQVPLHLLILIITTLRILQFFV